MDKVDTLLMMLVFRQHSVHGLADGAVKEKGRPEHLHLTNR